jgi:hypothetical protein
MPPTLSDPLSQTLHAFLVARAVEERNKELARALVAEGNRGDPNQLTRHWARPGVRLDCESLLADGDRVTLRLTAALGNAAWSLAGELRFDAAGRIVEYHDVLAPAQPPR